METAFTGVFVKDGDWYMAYVEELPGANTQGRILEEARENLREAVELILLSNRSEKSLSSGCGSISRSTAGCAVG